MAARWVNGTRSVLERATTDLTPLPPRRWWTQPVSSVLLLAGMLLVVLVREEGGVPAELPPALLGFTVLAWLPLLLRTRRPRLALVGAVAAESLHLALLAPVPLPAAEIAAIAAYQPVPLATMIAAWTVSSRTRGGWVWALTGGTVLLAVAVLTRPPDLLASSLITFNVVLLATFAGGVVTARRERAARQAREHAQETRRQVDDERLRIARDLHDVLGHHLALVDAQASVAAYLVRTDPGAAATALDGMAHHTRQALDGLRATVGLLRTPEQADGGAELAPPPATGRLDELLDAVRSTGTPVHLAVEGDPVPLEAAADVAVYRIVQEALTNAAKHAPGAPVEVALTWTHAHLDVRVANGPAPVPPTAPVPGSGHGLHGMRERATACGGTLDARPLPDGGFAVEALLPVPERTLP